MPAALPLDELLPGPAHRSRYETTVAASPEATWAALRGVTPVDLPVTRLLMTVRAAPALLARAGRGDGVRRADRPILDQFVDRGFSLLREEPPALLVAAAAGQPWRLNGGEMVRLADPGAARTFRRYWTVIRAGSALIRLDLLRAIRQAAEAPAPAP